MDNQPTGRGGRPDIKIRPDLLRQWLEPARACLEQRGWRLPPAGADTALDCPWFSEMLTDPPPGMPAELLESLYVIEEMADESGMDAILGAFRARGGLTGLEDAPTPADVAVQAWLCDRVLLQDLHNCQELQRPRTFQYFCTAARPVPPFPGPAPEQLRRLEERLDAFYLAWKRGTGARVFAYRQEPYWRFLIRHGAPCRRAPALEAGQPTSVFYRPQRHDVLIYDSRRGELQVHCCAERERRVLLRLFGSCFFGRTDFFPGISAFTLAPLVQQGRRSLACVDVPGLECVTLTEVEFAFHGRRWKRVTQKAADVFELLEAGELHWPARTEDITRARFAVQFRGARRERFLTITPSNRVAYSRDDDSRVLESWMEVREFME